MVGRTGDPTSPCSHPVRATVQPCPNGSLVYWLPCSAWAQGAISGKGICGQCLFSSMARKLFFNFTEKKCHCDKKKKIFKMMKSPSTYLSTIFSKVGLRMIKIQMNKQTIRGTLFQNSSCKFSLPWVFIHAPLNLFHPKYLMG